MSVAKLPKETEPQTLIAMHHPEFRCGYQSGRTLAFRGEALPLTDLELMDNLRELVQDGLFADGNEAADYFVIGQFLGKLSSTVIPRQPDEQDEDERKQRVFAHLRAVFPNQQEAEQVVKAVTTLWHAQDFLAAHLDADSYDFVLHRGLHPTLKLIY
jgi:hypothetical protein